MVEDAQDAHVQLAALHRSVMQCGQMWAGGAGAFLDLEGFRDILCRAQAHRHRDADADGEEGKYRLLKL